MTWLLGDFFDSMVVTVWGKQTKRRQYGEGEVARSLKRDVSDAADSAAELLRRKHQPSTPLLSANHHALIPSPPRPLPSFLPCLRLSCLFTSLQSPPSVLRYLLPILFSMTGQTNFYSQLLISGIWIVDINNSNTIGIVDIVDISSSNCWYQ